MKNLLLFILSLVANTAMACGFYPYGEDTRMSLFIPNIFKYSTYANFYYSANAFGTYEENLPDAFTLPNEQLWFAYCNGKVDLASINEAVYALAETDIHEQAPNSMIRYLVQQDDMEALDYLRFAKRCEVFNSLQEDPWERNAYSALPKRTALMNQAIALSKSVKHQELKKRYTFLAIRLAWYNQQYDQINALFTSVFSQEKKKDILYYWSLYFKTISVPDSVPTNFDLAQVFANAPDKRFVCHQHFDATVSLEQSLSLAKTKNEIASVYLLYGIEKPDKALAFLQKLYTLQPQSDGLSFLLLREINKIEDYVLTPYYTLFQPSLSYDYWGEESDMSTRETLNRSERDRLYAKDVLQFMNSVDLRKVENPLLWTCGKAYLSFLTRDYATCLRLVEQVEKTNSDNAILEQVQRIKALALVAKQPKGKAIIPAEVEKVLLANTVNSQYVFAIGKELEYLGNTTDAALLFANLDYQESDYSPVFWKSIKNRMPGYTDYFVGYFDYVDAVYTPEQTQALIDAIVNAKDKRDSFSVFKYSSMQQQITLLTDLLGTKYIRQNKLDKALAIFKQIDERYWMRTYSAWSERYNIFDKNPFFYLKYTPDFIAQKDTIRLNKYTVTKQLMAYLQQADNPQEQDRDYYYFLVANAYYNMGIEGNISMMRRMNGWSDEYYSVIDDEAEFRQSNLAKQYYLLAEKYAKTDKFKALCLRMAARCERNKLLFQADFEGNGDDETLLESNRYVKLLEAKYPDYADELSSNCDDFRTYFEARR